MANIQKNKSENSLCLQQIELFIRHLRLEKNYAENTLSAYRRDLNKLLLFVETKNINQWANVDEKILNLFVMELRHKSISNRSIRRHLSSIRGFFSYLNNHGVIKENCANHITSPKLAHVLPKTLDFDDLKKMMQAKSNSLGELRDVAMIELIYSCALRVSELVGLDTNELDLNEGFVKVMGKGAKMRFIPVGKSAISAVNNYLAIKPQSDNGALFTNRDQKRISVRTVQSMIKKRANSVGIKVDVHPHMLRHAAATHFLQSSHDLRSVQEYLGHKSIKSTQVYTHLDFLELSKVYDDCHPRAKK